MRKYLGIPIAGAIVVASWLPYISLRLYWANLLKTVPGAEHGEVSGPILFFLPWLMVFAAIVTFFALVYCAIAIRYRNPLDTSGRT